MILMEEMTDVALRALALECAVRSTDPTSAFAGGNTPEQGTAFILKRARAFEEFLAQAERTEP